MQTGYTSLLLTSEFKKIKERNKLSLRHEAKQDFLTWLKDQMKFGVMQKIVPCVLDRIKFSKTLESWVKRNNLRLRGEVVLWQMKTIFIKE